jgi:hypothetical protein
MNEGVIDLNKLTIIFAMLVLALVVSGCSNSGVKQAVQPQELKAVYTADEKIVEYYVKYHGYNVTARKGAIQKYTLEKNKLSGAMVILPYQQMWAV